MGNKQTIFHKVFSKFSLSEKEVVWIEPYVVALELEIKLVFFSKHCCYFFDIAVQESVLDSNWLEKVNNGHLLYVKKIRF